MSSASLAAPSTDVAAVSSRTPSGTAAARATPSTARGGPYAPGADLLTHKQRTDSNLRSRVEEHVEVEATGASTSG